jgi:hypothetical protein
MAKAPQREKLGFRGTLTQLRMAFVMAMKRDKLFLPLLGAAILVALSITVLMYMWFSWFAIPLGVMLVLLAALIVLNLRINKVVMAEAESQPGAAAAIIERMRGDFRVTPAVSATTDNDFVHLVISRAGVVLVGEGDPARVRSLMGHERKRLTKVIGSADLRDIIIGHGEGQVPLRKLRMTLLRMPRTLSQKDMISLDKRLKALSARPQLPKGAIPKNMRPPKGAFKAMRGGPR